MLYEVITQSRGQRIYVTVFCSHDVNSAQGGDMVRRDKANYIIQSVSHALDVLEEFRGDVDELV